MTALCFGRMPEMRSTYVPTTRCDQVFLTYSDGTVERIWPAEDTPAPSSLSWETIVKLYDGGFRSPDEVRQASDDDLLAVRGVGRKTLAEIRAHLPLT